EVTDMCDVVGKVDAPAATLPNPNIGFATLITSVSGLPSPSTNFCHVAPPFQPDVKVLGSYPLPWWNLQMSATVQSLPGPNIVAQYTAPNSLIAPSLGRNLAAGANGTATVQLVAPGALYRDRLNQVDVRVAKAVQVNRARIKGIVDVYNLFNASPALTL